MDSDAQPQHSEVERPGSEALDLLICGMSVLIAPQGGGGRGGERVWDGGEGGGSGPASCMYVCMYVCRHLVILLELSIPGRVRGF